MQNLKLVFFVGFLTLWSLPAHANPENCLNKQLQSPGMGIFDKAVQRSKVEFNGVRYHWLWLSASKVSGRLQNVPTVIAENDSGYCEMPLHDPSGAIRSQTDVEMLLGKPVSDLFVEESKKR
ncbi:hypothetical protein ACSYAD_33080 [Acaryochloris marina NIES-2412]|uniref:hypothetical protein n=1 Tax=Acaryochloris marina TaxID=155978 RepID=UPI0040587AD3